MISNQRPTPELPRIHGVPTNSVRRRKNEPDCEDDEHLRPKQTSLDVINDDENVVGIED